MSANSLVQELIDAGVHFGHRASRWNPKMRPYIYGRKNQIHIIDIRETVRGLLRAKKFVSEVASDGSLILFVGTKRQASAAVSREAERCNMPFVSERWLGGALTNFSTIRSRMGRLEELEEIRGGEKIAQYSKKAQSSLNREYRKIYRNLNGIRTMNRKPGCMIIVDPRKEKNAILEARSLGITTVALIDTNCDPDMVDLPIPGNDDGIRAVEVIMSHMADAVIAGAKNVVAKNEGKDKPGKKTDSKSAAKPPAPAAAAPAAAEAPAAEAAAAPADKPAPEATS
jgi:small subunit ribosomal protein S2